MADFKDIENPTQYKLISFRVWYCMMVSILIISGVFTYNAYANAGEILNTECSVNNVESRVKYNSQGESFYYDTIYYSFNYSSTIYVGKEKLDSVNSETKSLNRIFYFNNNCDVFYLSDNPSKNSLFEYAVPDIKSDYLGYFICICIIFGFFILIGVLFCK